MPINGEINDRFGVFKSLCCDAEIVIADGVAFPDCPRHPHLPTTWSPVVDEKFPHVSQLPEFKKSGDKAA